MEEFNLSKKIIKIETQKNVWGYFILSGDVKEFIQLLKEEVIGWNEEIDKLAGDELNG